MKKLLIAFIAIVYMGSASGIAMEIHYCMGKKMGVEFYGDDAATCNTCGMKAKKGCCHDQHQFYKIKDAHQTVTNELSVSAPGAAIITSYLLYNWPLTGTADHSILLNHSPPGYTRPSICILNCVFRI